VRHQTGQEGPETWVPVGKTLAVTEPESSNKRRGQKLKSRPSTLVGGSMRLPNPSGTGRSHLAGANKISGTETGQEQRTRTKWTERAQPKYAATWCQRGKLTADIIHFATGYHGGKKTKPKRNLKTYPDKEVGGGMVSGARKTATHWALWAIEKEGGTYQVATCRAYPTTRDNCPTRSHTPKAAR